MSLKRKQLIETAERLFYKEGFHATGIDRVIAEAGVARMTLYKHFTSKDELVMAVLTHREQNYWAKLDEAIASVDDTDESAVVAVIEAHLQWLINQGANGCIFIKALGEYAAHCDSVMNFAIEHKQRVIALIRKVVINDGLADQQLAEPLAFLLEGATAYAQVMPASQVAEQTRKTVEILIRSASAKNGGNNAP